jgi:hypothetical protein
VNGKFVPELSCPAVFPAHRGAQERRLPTQRSNTFFHFGRQALIVKV